MGFLQNIFKGKETQEVSKPTIDLTKKKEEVHSICLTKRPLNGLKAQVGLVLDFSGSMSDLYYNGTVQSVIENTLPLAMEFDDNGTMEVWIFDDEYYRLPDINLQNYQGYVRREILGTYNMGGTNYAPVINNVVEAYKDAKLPSYVLFITDGNNSDQTKTTHAITEAAKLPIFWQFVGIGNARFSYLEKLDDLTGRYVDNADFFEVRNVKDVTYRQLLNEFPGWLENERVKQMLR